MTASSERSSLALVLGGIDIAQALTEDNRGIGDQISDRIGRLERLA
jgi:hypothetical protein